MPRFAVVEVTVVTRTYVTEAPDALSAKEQRDTWPENFGEITNSYRTALYAMPEPTGEDERPFEVTGFASITQTVQARSSGEAVQRALSYGDWHLRDDDIAWLDVEDVSAAAQLELPLAEG